MGSDSFLENAVSAVDNQSQECIEHRKPWQPIIIVPESKLFEIMQSVLKNIEPKQETINIVVLNRKRSHAIKLEVKDYYKFIFNWQDESQCSVQCFKRIDDNDG